MKISIVVATDKKNAIGKNNKLPWHLPADLKYFKQLTSNHCIIMGRNTFESIGKALPKRVNIVLTTDKKFSKENIVLRHSVEEALAYCKLWGQQEVFIIGGAKVYEQVLPIADTIYITKVDTEVVDADAFFPEMHKDKWDIQKAALHTKDADNVFDFTFEVWEKRTQEPIVYK